MWTLLLNWLGFRRDAEAGLLRVRALRAEAPQRALRAPPGEHRRDGTVMSPDGFR